MSKFTTAIAAAALAFSGLMGVASAQQYPYPYQNYPNQGYPQQHRHRDDAQQCNANGYGGYYNNGGYNNGGPTTTAAVRRCEER